MSSKIGFPNIKEPFTDPTSRLNRTWYLFLQELWRRSGGGSAPDIVEIIERLDELDGQVGDLDTLFNGVAPQDALLAVMVSRIAAMEARAADVVPGDSGYLAARVRELESRLSGVVAPCQPRRIDDEGLVIAHAIESEPSLHALATATEDGFMSAADKAKLDSIDTSYLLPTGTVALFFNFTPPTGWLKLNGQAVSRTGSTAALFALYGTTYGAGDGSTTFNLPEVRGEFLRFWDDGRGVDSGRTLGSAQAEQVGPHTHTVPHQGSFGYAGGVNTAFGLDGTTDTTSNGGGTENRPRNVAPQACVKT